MIQDVINGSFEAFLGVLIWLNVYRLHKDKTIKGISLIPTVFYILWGFWNIYYYPYLGQIISMIGGIFIVLANTVWVAMAIYYRNK